jgi:MerR family transcriptional regulator/heat shock protein HspR
MNPDLHPDRAVYSISVAAELTDLNPQTLRGYESKGLLAPYRTPGGTRRYSSNDLNRIRRITTLLAAGINLTGIRHVLDLEAQTAHLRAQLRHAQQAADNAPGSTEPDRPKDGHVADGAPTEDVSSRGRPRDRSRTNTSLLSGDSVLARGPESSPPQARCRSGPWTF